LTEIAFGMGRPCGRNIGLKIRNMTPMDLIIKPRAWLALACLWFLAGPPAVADDNTTEPIKPIPLTVELDWKAAKLGERLFHDPRLSTDDSVSCATCHNLGLAGVDKKRYSTGAKGLVGGRNTPTVFNSGLNFRQLWDGRAVSLEEQIEKVIHAKKVMASSWAEVISKLQQDPRYPELFAKAYPDGLTAANIIHAIASFERSLITPNSRFDRYLRGDRKALSARELRGYELFKDYGCITCHQGVNVGGNMFQRFGVMDEIPGRDPEKADPGRFKVTGEEDDRFVFRVPSLRLAARTPPYFHDGSAETLRDAVDIMIRAQLGRAVPREDRDDIIRFLKSLVGSYKGKPL
jgi:cytochrome c peroxidase